MKITAQFMMLLIASTIAIACSKDDDKSPNSGGGTIATLPQPSNRCVQDYNPNAWTPYRDYGFSPYSGYGDRVHYNGRNTDYRYNDDRYSWRNRRYGNGTYGLSSNPASSYGYPYNQTGPVPSNYSPSVYQPDNGFCGCANGTIPVCDNERGMACVNSNYLQNQRYAVWHYDSNQQAYSFGQWGNSGYTGYNNNGNRCYSGFGQVCDTNLQNCGGPASVCLQTVPGSSMGVCVAR